MALPEKVDRIRQELEEKDSLKLRLVVLTQRALQFKEGIWSDDEEFWDKAEKHPIRFKARYADMNTIFSKPWADRIINEQSQTQHRERITAEKLEELNLTDAQIEKLATVNDADPTD